MSSNLCVSCSDVNGDQLYIDKLSGNTVFGFSHSNGVAGTQVGNPIFGSANALVAHAGGGQTSATQILAVCSRFTTVSTTSDSAVLPPAIAGAVYFVKNAGAQTLAVYPAGTTDVINALAVQTAYTIATVKAAIFVCFVTGTWDTILTA